MALPKLPTLYFFFFSSRRRHTRSLRDWSSDVCSSDLLVDHRGPTAERLSLRTAWIGSKHVGPECDVSRRGRARSEERRVGKECRSRWSAYLLKRKSVK